MGSAIVAKRLVLPLLIGKVPIFQFLTNEYIKCFFLKCWQKFYMVLELTCQACSTYLSVYVVKNFIQKMKVFSFGYHTYLYMITFTFPTNYLVRTKSTTLQRPMDLCFSNKLRCGLISQSYFFVFVLVKGGEFHLDFWILLVPKMVISKLSGNTVRSTHPRLQKAF